MISYRWKMEPLAQLETFEQKAPEVLADLAKHIEF